MILGALDLAWEAPSLQEGEAHTSVKDEGLLPRQARPRLCEGQTYQFPDISQGLLSSLDLWPSETYPQAQIFGILRSLVAQGTVTF